MKATTAPEAIPRGVPTPAGTYVGRWAVQRRAPSVQRPWWSGSLSRVVCECVCGREQIVLDRDIKLGRSQGCRSKACRNAWVFAELLVPTMGMQRAREFARELYEAEVPTYQLVRQAAFRLFGVHLP